METEVKADGTATPTPVAEAPKTPEALVTSEAKPEVKSDATPVEKPVESVKPTEVEIALELSDDSPLEDSVLEDIKAIAKEKGLTQEQATALLAREDKAARAKIESTKGLIDSWKQAVTADKEIGGDNLPVAVENAKRVLEKYGSPDLKKGLDETGLGNHPELVRMLSRIGKAMADDSFVKSAASGKQQKSIEDVLYG